MKNLWKSLQLQVFAVLSNSQSYGPYGNLSSNKWVRLCTYVCVEKSRLCATFTKNNKLQKQNNENHIHSFDFCCMSQRLSAFFFDSSVHAYITADNQSVSYTLKCLYWQAGLKKNNENKRKKVEKKRHTRNQIKRRFRSSVEEVLDGIAVGVVDSCFHLFLFRCNH